MSNHITISIQYESGGYYVYVFIPGEGGMRCPTEGTVELWQAHIARDGLIECLNHYNFMCE
jgi:hypothetical protein